MKINKIIILTMLIMAFQIYATIFYVTVEGNGTMDGSSWANAYNGEQLNYAMDDFWADEVWVAKGVYKPNSSPSGGTTDRDKHFRLSSSVEVYGGFNGTETDIAQRDIKNNETILSGDIGVEGDNSDNCYHVFNNPPLGISPSAILDGFTVCDGNANGGSYLLGGAIINYDSAPTIRNCIFKNNYASYVGGAVVNYYNYRTGIVIENCLFFENEAAYGGAIYSAGLSTIITNCTFVNNSATDGSAIYLENTSKGANEVTNNIVWGNNGTQIVQNDAYTVKFSFNAIEGGYNGFGNINLSSNNTGGTNSPYFTDPDNNDYSLQSSSPCIDAGVFWNALNVDINNQVRPQGVCFDIGAYEYESVVPNAVKPVVSTLLPVYVTINSAICKGSVTDNGGTQLITKGIIYSLISGFNPETEGTLIKANELYETGDFSMLISPLVPDTTYYYRAYSENMVGYTYGEIQSFTTNSGIMPDANGILYIKTDGAGDGSSWANALNGNDLQLGIDDSDVKEIWVAKGKYVPTGWPSNYKQHELNETDFVYKFQDYNQSETKYNGTSEREKHFMLRPNKKIYGGFIGTETSLEERDFRINETILSGDIGAEGYALDNVYHVIYNYFEPDIDFNAVIDGFTIQNGYADGFIRDDSYFGGGMFNRCSSPTIRNCTFKNNYGVWGGGMINGYSDDYGYSKPVIYNTEITQNFAMEGGGIYDIAGYPLLTNCVITKNSAQKGGGIYHWADSFEFDKKDKLIINHCTVAGNVSPNGSQILLNLDDDNPALLFNSTIWGEYPALQIRIDDVIRDFPYYTSLYFCANSDNFSGTGEGNIKLSSNNEGDTNSPYFTDTVNNDYSLQYNSACKDMAIYKYKTDEDILGTERPQGAAYDMGAYEYETPEPNAVLPLIATGSTDSITVSSALCFTDVIDNGGTMLVVRGVKISRNVNFNPEIDGQLYSLKGDYASNEFITFVSGLAPNAKYYYRSYAMNRMGYSYGQQEEFTTSALVPDANGILYVKQDGVGNGSSWETALSGNDIQTAINYSSNKQIWVAKGIYKPNSWTSGGSTERDKHFTLKSGIQLFGGFEGNEISISERDINNNQTILSGDIGIENDSTDNCCHIINNISEKIYLVGGDFRYSIDSTAVIDGFTITKGYDNIPNNMGGAGMYNNNASPTVRNCNFINNQALFASGGAINNVNYLDFLLHEKLNMRIESCVFGDNKSLYQGGGLINISSSKFDLIGCVFMNNYAIYGGGIMTCGWTKIANCLFYNNKAEEAGGAITLLTIFHTSIQIINSSIVNNSAQNGAAGVYPANSYNTVILNTVFFNKGNDFTAWPMEDIPDINNCAISSELDFEYTGSNNILLSVNNSGDANSPYFSDPENGNWMIQEHSPLRDAGILAVDVPLYDILGYLRDSQPDIGCYEYDPTSIEESDNILPLNTELFQNYPNPFNPTTNIKFSLSKAGKVELSVFNLAGQLVRKVLDKEMTAGYHTVKFEEDNLNSGLYFYKLKANGKELTKKMLMVK